MKPEILKTETVFSGWNRMHLVTARTRGGAEIRRSVEDHGQAVAVLPYDPTRRVAILVRQLRPPMLFAGAEPITLEAPAGMLDDPEPEACARREAMEEAGLRLTTLDKVGAMAPMPGVSTELIHLFLAPFGAADRVGEGGGLGEEVEEIEVVEVALAELAALVDSGSLLDMKTVVLVEALRRRQPALFA
jgi:nudix-type nucleoside diphosphatase (YffH/AdpP family)